MISLPKITIRQSWKAKLPSSTDETIRLLTSPQGREFLELIRQTRLSSAELAKLEKAGFPDWSYYYDIFIPLALTPKGVAELLKTPIPKVFKTLIQAEATTNSLAAAALGEKEYLTFLFFAAIQDSFTCLLAYRKPLMELLAKARQGDDNALFKLVAVNKAILTTDWAVKRLRRAQLEHDRNFFKELAKAIRDTPAAALTPPQKILAFILILFWEAGLKFLTRRELFEYFEEVGLYGEDVTDITDEMTLAKFVNRLGLYFHRTKT